MATLTQHGYLVLADISGFTAYLAGVELDHAHEILSDLLETIVGRFKTLLTISKLEGDAVFGYAPESKVPRGETLLDLLESTYVAFRDRQTAMHRRTTCECSACRSIPRLDLKFITHHGDYLLQDVAGIAELLGSDVNLAHRLMKNHVSEATGWHAYALFTEASLGHMGVSPDGMHAQPETYEHLGEVKTYSLNLHERHQAITEARRVFLSPEEADLVLTHDFAAPPPVVWDWLNNPEKRSRWMHDRRWSADARPGGRTSVGSRNHCAHGKNTIIETILDWRPFDYVTGEQIVNNTRMVETVQLEPLPDGAGTRMRDHIKFEMGLPPFLRRPLVKLLLTKMVQYKSDEIHAGLARLMVAEETESTPGPADTQNKPA